MRFNTLKIWICLVYTENELFKNVRIIYLHYHIMALIFFIGCNNMCWYMGCEHCTLYNFLRISHLRVPPFFLFWTILSYVYNASCLEIPFLPLIPLLLLPFRSPLLPPLFLFFLFFFSLVVIHLSQSNIDFQSLHPHLLHHFQLNLQCFPYQFPHS